MKMLIEYIKLAISEIMSNKFNTFLTVLGIIVGISSVTLILSLGEGVTKLVKNQVATYKENVIYISYSPNKSKSDNSKSAFKSTENNLFSSLINMANKMSSKKRLKKTEVWPLPFDINQTKKEILKCPYVEKTDFYAYAKFPINFYTIEQNIGVSFSNNNFVDYLKEKIVFGRLFSDYEIKNNVPVALLKMNPRNYREMIAFGGPLNKNVSIDGVTFKIIGIVEGTSLELYVPYNFYHRIATLNDSPQYLVKLKKGGNDKQKVKDFFSWMKAYAYNGEYFREDSNIGLFNQILDYLPKFTLLITAIAGISLIVGGIGIMNSMISSVVQRTKEIGIRKSIGAKKHTLVIQFMIETVIITLFGGIVGILFGVLLSTAVLSFFKIPPVFPTITIVYCIIFTIITGIASGVVPAVKAAKLDPIEALGHS